MRLVELLDRVAEQSLRAGERLVVSGHPHHVAELQAEPGHRGELDVRPRHAAQDGAASRVERELADRLPEYVLARHHDAPLGHVARRSIEILVAAPSDDALEPVQHAGGSHGEDRVAALEERAARGHAHRRLADRPMARHDDARLAARGDVGDRHARQVRVVDHERTVLERLGASALLCGEGLRFGAHVNPEQAL
jgi:hypothetical protein